MAMKAPNILIIACEDEISEQMTAGLTYITLISFSKTKHSLQK